MRESEKVMFEIYREASYNRRYKVVYFTEANSCGLTSLSGNFPAISLEQ